MEFCLFLLLLVSCSNFVFDCRILSTVETEMRWGTKKMLFWTMVEDVRCHLSSWGRENHFVFGEQLPLSLMALRNYSLFP